MAVQFVNNQFIWGSVQAVTKAVIGQSNSYTGDYTTYIRGDDGLHVYGTSSSSSNTLFLVDYGDSNKVIEATPLPRFRAGDISGVGNNTFIEADSSGFDVYNGSDARFTVNGNTGNVGIGVSNPGAQLEIADSSNSSSGLRFTAVNTGNQDTVNMHFQGTAGTAPFYISRASTGGAEIQLQFDGDLILNGNNGDNVGIGTTTPQQQLHVSSNILCGGNMYFNTGTSNYISGVGGGLEWYTNSNKIVDITYGGEVDITNDLNLNNDKAVSWGSTGGTAKNIYIEATDGVGNNGRSQMKFINNACWDWSGATDGQFVFKNDNPGGTPCATYGTVFDIVHGSTSTSNNQTINIRLGRDKDSTYSYTGGFQYTSTNNSSTRETFLFRCANRGFLRVEGTLGGEIDKIKLGSNLSNTDGKFDFESTSGGSIPFFVIKDTQYQPSTSLSNPVLRLQNNFHSTNSRYQIVFQRYSSTSSIRGSIATNNSGTTYNTTSDYRLKTDAKDFNALDLVKQIPVYDFKWKYIDNRDYGCFAHELNEVIPNAVHGEKDAVDENGENDYQQADYSKIVPVLLKAIQELEAKVKTLENK